MASNGSSRPEEEKNENVNALGEKAEKMSMSDSDRVVSCTNKLYLTEEAMTSFGGPDDIFRKEKVPSQGGTINYVLTGQRQFEAGEYVMHIVTTDPEPEAESSCKVAILCLEDLCPVKIHNRLTASNMGQDHKATNYMSRYDWFHTKYWGPDTDGEDEFGEERKKFINVIRRDVFGEPDNTHANEDEDEWEDEDEEEDEEEEKLRHKFLSLAFFVDVNYLADISAGKFTCERENDWVFLMKGTGNEAPIGFIIQDEGEKAEDCVFSPSIWNYGCVLVDEQSAKCFAFVFGDYYTYRYLCQDFEKEPNDFDICKINYTFNKEYFQKEN